MIVELSVENVAIIERSQITLGSGFTVLTGETGAGKSLLVDAIELALGERADSDLVRSGAARATVTAVFDLSSQPEIRARCESLGLSLEDDALFVQREVFAEGRSQCRVGGKMAPVAALRALGQILVDLHGQHDHQSLLHQERHGDLLDAWIGEPATTLKAQVDEKFSQAESTARKLALVRQGLRDREHRLDLLRFQVSEIEAVAPVAGEMEELESQLKRLQHAEKLALITAEASQSLSADDGSARDRLSAALKRLQEASAIDSSLDPTVRLVTDAFVSLEEGLLELDHYASTLESDPGALEEIASRLDALKRLRRKYGEDETAVLSFLETARTELEDLEFGEGSGAELEALLETQRADLERLARALTDLRSQKAVDFALSVGSELQDLAMQGSRFGVKVDGKSIDSTGADRIEFWFSANSGEPEKPLAKIASGGEISRVMLAIKTALSGRAGVPTLIFDEVDAGLSGRAAAVVAKKLEALSRHYQVIAISHLPQIASRATSHFRIEKSEQNGRVVTVVNPLTHEERVVEIARLLAGEQVTNTALENAREMLAGAAT